MKDIMKDRLIQLATAQEFMADVADKMTRWDKSQLVMEKSAFESLNYSDEVLNLSKEGSSLVARLLECCQAVVKSPGVIEQKKMTSVLEEIHDMFNKINEASSNINEIAHKIEGEAAIQKEIEEDIKISLIEVGESVDAAAACAEFIMADF